MSRLIQELELQMKQSQSMEEWSKRINVMQAKSTSINEKIFYVKEDIQMGLLLYVNIHPEILNLFKSLKQLTHVKMKVTAFLSFTADDVKQIYQSAVLLTEALEGFYASEERLNEKQKVLVASQRQEILNVIAQSTNITWNCRDQLKKFVEKLFHRVELYEEISHLTVQGTSNIEEYMEAMEEGEFSAVQDNIELIQGVVDSFELKNLSNLKSFVDNLNRKIFKTVKDKLFQALKKWINAFENWNDNESFYIHSPLTHEIQMQDKQFVLVPSLCFSKKHWYDSFSKFQNQYLSLPQVQCDRYSQNQKGPNFQEVSQSIDLCSFYQAINEKLSEVENYVNTWLSYQALNEISFETIEQYLQTDIQKWSTLLVDIKNGRNTFDNSETSKAFGAILIDYKKVQSSIFQKYDFWHKEILNHFGKNHQKVLVMLNDRVLKQKHDLEITSFTLANPTIYESIQHYEDCRLVFAPQQNELELLKIGQSVLEKQKFLAPGEYISTHLVENNWSNYKKIFVKQNQAFEKIRVPLQDRIVQDERETSSLIQEFEADWKKEQPLEVTLFPGVALEKIKEFQQREQRLAKRLGGIY